MNCSREKTTSFAKLELLSHPKFSDSSYEKQCGMVLAEMSEMCEDMKCYCLTLSSCLEIGRMVTTIPHQPVSVLKWRISFCCNFFNESTIWSHLQWSGDERRMPPTHTLEFAPHSPVMSLPLSSLCPTYSISPLELCR